MTREPQVGDVYYDKVFDNYIAIKTDYDTYWYAYQVDYLHIGNPAFYHILECEAEQISIVNNMGYHPASFTLPLITIQTMEYKGKIAPRYKRIFGTYFIPDKPND